jgi:hypothetical protein
MNKKLQKSSDGLADMYFLVSNPEEANKAVVAVELCMYFTDVWGEMTSSSFYYETISVKIKPGESSHCKVPFNHSHSGF